MVGTFTKELRTTVRSLSRSPTIALSAVLCLAVGIGATAAISSALYRALLRPLPFDDPARLVAVHRVTPNSGPMGTWPQSAPNYVDLATRTRQIENLAALSFGTALVQLKDGGLQASELFVSGNLFGMLGVRTNRGRTLLPDDERDDRPMVAVLSDEFWRGRFGADPTLVGQVVNIDGQPTTIVGILPPDLRIPHGFQSMLAADVWKPQRFTPRNLAARRSNYLRLLGRLAPGATVASADAEMKTLFTGLVADHPELRGENLRVAPLQAENAQSVRTPLLLLFGAVCMVLLIAATNVAALLLARGVQRRREMAVRTALGATHWGTMRPALLESLVIAAAGVAGGLLLAMAGVRTIGSLAAARIPQLAGLEVDWRIVALALVTALIVAGVCGVVPALRAAAVDPQDALRGGRGGGRGREHHRALHALVVMEISLSLILLIGAGLVLKGFMRLMDNDPGFETASVLVANVAADPSQYPDRNAEQRFLGAALEAIKGIPGVTAAGAISAVPYQVWGNNSNVRYEGMAGDDPTRLPMVEQRGVSPGFFDVTGQRLIAGRFLRPSDEDPAAPAVVVVNRTLADRDFSGRDPIGQRFHTSDTSFATIVGVVSDIRNNGPVQDPAAEMYWTYPHFNPGATNFPLMIRVASGDPMSLALSVRQAIRRTDPTAAVGDMRAMPEVIARALGRPRFYFSLLGGFAGVAIVLALAGLYGVLSYAVAQRTREMGIRSALGSSGPALMRLVAGQGARLVIIGLAIGMLGGAAVTRLMEFMLYGVSPVDAATWALCALLMAAAAALAVFLPARRAARADPLVAIQAE